MTQHKNKRARANPHQELRRLATHATPHEREAIATIIRHVIAAKQGAALDGDTLDDQRLHETVQTLANYAPVLHEHPDALMALETMVQRAGSTAEALQKDGRPSGTIGQSISSGPGYQFLNVDEKDAPKGVPNTRTLRRWADEVTWVRKAILVLRNQVANADIDILPRQPEKRVDTKTQKYLRRLFQQPNRMRQNWSELLGAVVDDLETLDRGCIEKVQTVGRQPTELYALNGAGVKIYPNWDGDPEVPRYLYQEPDTFHAGRPLLNDECVVLMMNMATYRFGLSPVQVLIEEIQADIAAMKQMKRQVSMKPPSHFINLPGFGDRALVGLKKRYLSEFAGKEDLFLVATDPDKLAQVFSLVTSAKDSLFLELQLYLARKIGVLFGVSPAKLGILFDANRANTDTQQEVDEDVGLLPLYYCIERYLNREVLGDFAPQYPDGRSNLDALNLRAVFPVVSESQRLKHIARVADVLAKGLAGLPFMTLDMALAIIGEQPVDGGNTFYTNSKNGAIPWLSYDGRTGDFQPGYGTTGPHVGAQDPAGGPPSDEEAPPPAKPAPDQEPLATGGGEDDSAGDEDPDTDAAKRYVQAVMGTVIHSFGVDTRPPGVAWRPAHHIQSTVKAAARPTVTARSRAALEARARAIFAEVGSHVGSTERS
jgi:phage portal protein BeeE